MVIDYSDLPANIDLSEITFDVTVTAGRVLETIVQPNPLAGARVTITFDPQGAGWSEIRGIPTYQGAAIGETWLYRWTGR